MLLNWQEFTNGGVTRLLESPSPESGSLESTARGTCQKAAAEVTETAMRPF